jgi:hypothetical protein
MSELSMAEQRYRTFQHILAQYPAGVLTGAQPRSVGEVINSALA